MNRQREDEFGWRARPEKQAGTGQMSGAPMALACNSLSAWIMEYGQSMYIRPRARLKIIETNRLLQSM